MKAAAAETEYKAPGTPAIGFPFAISENFPGVLFCLSLAPSGAGVKFHHIGGACDEVLGLSAAMLTLDGNVLLQKFDERDARTALKAIESAFDGFGEWRVRFQMRGTSRWIEWHGRVQSDAAGIKHAQGYLTDATECVTSQLERERRSAERDRLWTSVMKQSDEGIMICDPQQRIVTVNAAFERVTGFKAAEVIGQTPSVLHSGRQDRAFYQKLWETLRASGHWSGEIWNRRRSGELYLEWMTIHSVFDEAGTITHYVGSFSDITVRRAVEARAQRLAEFDSLTDLLNRVGLSARLEHLIGQSQQNQCPLAVLYVDLDRFNNINDSMGHDAGDRLLCTVARRIEGALRKTDVVARMGADEFVVLLPGTTRTADAAGTASKILAAIAEPLHLGGQAIAISACIGICMYPDDGAESEDLLRNAAAAMLRAKRTGQSAFEFYAPAMNASAAQNLRIENELRLAIEKDELVLHYQPQVDLATGAVTGVEALVRWNKPGAGLVMPGQFIPIAEERGLILLLGKWVMRQAIRQVQAWDALGLKSLVVSVNVTASEFHQPQFAEDLATAAREQGVDPHRIELELTEGIAVQDLEGTTRTLQELHASGFRLSLDDFGTGYSSLNYLRRFPIDRIKIDQSFVRELDKQPGAERIVRAIIGLARSFSMQVIAEGVETQAQLSALRTEGCDQAQGYLFGKAMPPVELAGLLRDGPPSQVPWRYQLEPAIAAPESGRSCAQVCPLIVTGHVT